MSIKVNDIVVNLITVDNTGVYKVGQYVDKYDVRILPEMATLRKYAEVMYIDNDGAIITKEFGPYAYPADALRLATEEEKKEYETEKYTLVMKFHEDSFELPLKVAKPIIDAGIKIGAENIDANESLVRFVRDSWDTILRGEDESKRVLLLECYDILRRRTSASKNLGQMEYLVNTILSSKNNEIVADFVQSLYANPIFNKNFYQDIENRGHEIPSEYGEIIRKVAGYSCAALIKGMDLYDYLKESACYDSYFPHYNQLKVSRKGIDYAYRLLGRGDLRRLFEKLSVNMDDLKYILMNPRRDFEMHLDPWFYSLEWDEIIEHKDLFHSSLNSENSIRRRLSAGKYVAPEVASKMFARSGYVEDLMNASDKIKNKSELKLKEMVAYLDTLADNVTIDDIQERRHGVDVETVSCTLTHGSIRFGDFVEVSSPTFPF